MSAICRKSLASVCYSPAPAEERWAGTTDSHKPGEGDSTESVVTGKLKGSKRFTDDQISLERQNSQRPGCHQSCGSQRGLMHDGTNKMQKKKIDRISGFAKIK